MYQMYQIVLYKYKEIGLSMPGLIDSHIHMQGMNNRSEVESDVFLEEKVSTIFKEQLFPYGITSMKDLGSPRHFSYKLRDKINRGEILGPKYLIVGPNITAVGGHPAVTLGGENPWVKKELAAEVDSDLDAKNIVKELANQHVDFLKIVYQGGSYFYFDTELFIQKLDIKYVNTIIEEAEKVDLKVTAHVRYKNDVVKLLTTKLYGVEHGITDENITANDPILDQWKKQGAYYVPTMHALFLEHDGCVKVLTVITKYAFIWTGIGWYDSKTGELLKYTVKGKEVNAMYLTHIG